MPEFGHPEPGEDSFGVAALGGIFKYVDFPITRRDLIQKYGDREIEYSTGETMTLRDILEGSSVEKFNSLNELEQVFHEKLRAE